jgi:predicted enzyme related to lactoylglutathione lyase
MANSVHIRLLVQNFAQCFHFYKDVLGFPYRAGDETGPYAEFHVGEHTILGLFVQEYMTDVLRTHTLPPHPPSQDRFVICLEVPDVDALALQLASRGISMVNEPMNMPDWRIRVAHFRDPEGNIIEINQPM